MGRIEDPNWRYRKVEETQKPGYLERRMKIYKEMVRAENQGVSAISQKSDNGAGHYGQVSSKPDNGIQGRKLVAVRGKA